MSLNWQDSIILILSTDSGNSRFGTGFVIHRDDEASYVLTCAHVVEDVGGPDKVKAGGSIATVVASGEKEGLDLAVLRCDGALNELLLPLRPAGARDRRFVTAGFQLFGKDYLIRTLRGKLGEQVGLESRQRQERIEAWDLQITDNYFLQPGYSGSPVIDQKSGYVLGIVSHRQGEGEKGLAISLKALEAVWPEMPSGLFEGQTPLTFRSRTEEFTLKEVVQRTRQDWGEAPGVPVFFGRAKEQSTIEQWIVQDRCRLVALLGMGGIGKTVLAARLAQQLQGDFEVVIWRSLRNAPPIGELLAELIRFISNEPDIELPDDNAARISLLLNRLKTRRCLLILDNAETILQRQHSGDYLEGYEDYGKLLRRIGEGSHQSCLVLTSREKPREIGPMEGETSPVRSCLLTGLSSEEGQQMLIGKGLFGSNKDWETLVEHYSGNPLALSLVTEMIREVYAGEVSEFLAEDEMIFGRISDVIGEQFARASALEQSLMFWLAIEREPASRETLLDNLVQPMPKRNLMVALRALRRRSLIETSGPNFTLQNVVMEYMTDRLIEQVYGEIISFAGQSERSPRFFAPLRSVREGGSSALINSHALIQATAKDYVRETQIRLILKPVADRLLAVFGNAAGVETQLKQVLARLQEETLQASPLQQKSGYAAGNILNLLCQMEIDLTGYDLSHLTVWQAFLRDVNLHQVNFAQADIARSIFTETMPSVFAATFSPDGQLFAMSDYAGEIHLWQVATRKKLFTYQGHTRQVHSIDFSPDGLTLASGSDDETIKLWDVKTGRHLRTLEGHTSWVRAVAFHPDGQTIASGSYDQTVKLWNIHTGECSMTLPGHTSWVRAVAFSPEGTVLGSGGGDHLIKLWNINTSTCLADLPGHDAPIFGVAFDSTGQMLASASGDYTVKLWDVGDTSNHQCLATLEGHTNEVYAVAFSPNSPEGLDGHILATTGQDQTIKLWDIGDVKNSRCLSSLRGHTSWVWAVDFNPVGNLLLSGSADQTVKLWDIQNVNEGKCVATWQGYTGWIRSVAFNSQGDRLASASADKVIRIWDVEAAKVLVVMEGHTDQVHSVAFSLDDKILASAGWDGLAKIWDVQSGQCLATLAEHASTPWSVAFHPDGKILATGSNDTTIKLWDAQSGQCLMTLTEHTAQVYDVTFSPDGSILASGSFDSTVKLWDIQSGECVVTLPGYEGEMIETVAFSPDGSMLACGNRDNIIRLWDIDTKQRLTTLEGHSGWIYSVAFSPRDKVLASGSSDNTVRLWDTETYQCLATLEGHTSWVHGVAFSPDGSILASGSGDETIRLTDVKTRQHLKTLRAQRPYEGTNITGVTGISEAQKATLIALGAVVGGD